MEMTQADYMERLDRVEDGTATDEDLRLIKHYRREGYDQPADGSWLFQDTEGDTRVRDQNYGALTRAQLQRLAKDRDLPATGSQEELIDRLRKDDDRRAKIRQEKPKQENNE